MGCITKLLECARNMNDDIPDPYRGIRRISFFFCPDRHSTPNLLPTMLTLEE